MIFVTALPSDTNNNPDTKNKNLVGYAQDVESARNFIKHNINKLADRFKYIVLEDIEPGYKSAVFEKKWYLLAKNNLIEIEKPFSVKSMACFAVDI